MGEETKKIIIEIKVGGEKRTKEIEKIASDLLTELVKQPGIVSTHIEIERKKDLDEIMEEALANAPLIKGYTIRPLSDTIKSPWSTTRWHLKRMEAPGIVRP